MENAGYFIPGKSMIYPAVLVLYGNTGQVFQFGRQNGTEFSGGSTWKLKNSLDDGIMNLAENLNWMILSWDFLY